MSHAQRQYLPAAGHNFLLPLYDPFTKLLGIDKIRRSLLSQSELRAGHRVLDIGCGTGSLVVRIKRRHPEVDVVGLDPDPKALSRARRKADRAAATIQLDQGSADALPYQSASFDRVLSSFMFHHLDSDVKEGMLREIRRVLKPGGRCEMVDFGGREQAGKSAWRRWLHSHKLLLDNDENRVVALFSEAGFDNVHVVDRRAMLFGSIVFYQARCQADEVQA